MSAGNSDHSRCAGKDDEFSDMLSSGRSALLRPSISRSKLAKRLNKLIYDGDIAGLMRTIRENKEMTRKCLAFLTSDSYRDIVERYL